eukprot:53050-Eustigmatos_ZCMA.PRE.1
MSSCDAVLQAPACCAKVANPRHSHTIGRAVGGEPPMAANEHPELAFKPHNLQANQLETTQSVALYDAAARLDVEE